MVGLLVGKAVCDLSGEEPGRFWWTRRTKRCFASHCSDWKRGGRAGKRSEYLSLLAQEQGKEYDSENSFGSSLGAKHIIRLLILNTHVLVHK